ncbi:hypothetical protein PVAND_017337 [Polypedilum vanderplanki]|uniref:Peptidase S1 domain-containing protein n=1 Tax=Polypedilum vanderplanki TaxID=319348 RepID=A0A9J6BIB2_POLVA|nr:hypothetical protein PVAND_017337 [Polypedilum vanderplanki]
MRIFFQLSRKSERKMEHSRRIVNESQTYRSTKRQYILLAFIVCLAVLPLILLGLYYAFADDTCECGKVLISGTEQKENRDAEVKISYNGQWPWTAQLFKTPQNFTCDATIITNRHLLTAAHCVEDEKNVEKYFALVGQRVWTKKQISKIYVHINLAVLKLSEPLEFNDFIQPICLPDLKTFSIEKIQMATMASYDNYESLIKSLDVITTVSSDCGKDIICAFNNVTNSCLTHSGSGLFVKNEKTQQQSIIGIAAKSPAFIKCRPSDVLAFFQLSPYKPWIYEKILECDKDEKDCQKPCNIENLKL